MIIEDKWRFVYQIHIAVYLYGGIDYISILIEFWNK